MDAEALLKLLILTWIADGKTEPQIQAFCRAARLTPDDVAQVIVAFRTGLPRSLDVKHVREEAQASMRDTARALRAAAGDTALAVMMLRKEGLAWSS